MAEDRRCSAGYVGQPVAPRKSRFTATAPSTCQRHGWLVSTTERLFLGRSAIRHGLPIFRATCSRPALKRAAALHVQVDSHAGKFNRKGASAARSRAGGVQDPPCASTSLFARCKPVPNPPCERGLPACPPCANRANIESIFFTVMPIPLSVIATTALLLPQDNRMDREGAAWAATNIG
jgi:hypothetical protein